jgi:hypothetical protein
MGHYKLANGAGLVSLQYQPQQVAFLHALAARHCNTDAPNNGCGFEWQMKFGDEPSTYCPRCHKLGFRDYTKMLLFAGRQGGKTRVGTLGGVLEASMPNSYGWVTAPTYRDLTDFVEPAFFAQVPQWWIDEGDWNVGDRLLVLPNGARVAFRSLEDPQSARGPTLDWWLMDEACQVSGIAHEVGDAMLAIKQGVEILTTTPQGEDWVYEEVWCRAEQGEPGYWAARWKSTANPIMSKAFIDGKKATMSPEMFEQEYEAGIVTFQGAIYGANMVEPLVIDDETEAGLELLKRYIPEWPKVDPARTCLVGLDPGSDHPFAGSLAVVTEHAIIVIGEYLMREKPAIIHAANLRAMVGNLQPRWGVDRSQPQTIIELAQHGIFAQSVEAGPGSVVAGIERVKSWMVTGRMRFVKTRTKQTVAQLKTYRWKKNEKNDGSTAKQEPYKKKDDLCDALSYLVRMWPHLPAAPEVEQGVRDLTKLGDTERRDIERVMHHMEQVRRDKIEDGVGEFYDTVVDGHGGAFDEFYA